MYEHSTGQVHENESHCLNIIMIPGKLHKLWGGGGRESNLKEGEL